MNVDRLVLRLASLRQQKHGGFYPNYQSDDFASESRHETVIDGQTIQWSQGQWLHEHVTDDHWLDRIRYQVNSDGQHWHEFTREPDILALGCSVTNGMGLPYNFTWPSIIEHVFGLKVNNIGRTSHNVHQQMYRMIAHIGTYGFPKRIALLSPDIWRANLFEFSSQQEQGRKTLAYNDQISSYTTFDDQTSKFHPYLHQAVDNSITSIPVDVITDQNLAAIDMIAMLAPAIGAEMTMFSWHGYSQQILEHIGYPELQQVPSYLIDEQQNPPQPKDYLGWGFPEPAPWLGVEGCCELEPTSQWQEAAWTQAFDRGKNGLPHPGLHSHIHFAEIMSGERITSDMIKELKPWYEGTHLDALHAGA
jgi:hypothetical protein